ncbi:hypothetical protein DO72_4694 [Burkholderia pseudomallei]|nr:hypothetical protein DO72_4694 [Burkholderia pseudomallei]
MDRSAVAQLDGAPHRVVYFTASAALVIAFATAKRRRFLSILKIQFS